MKKTNIDAVLAWIDTASGSELYAVQAKVNDVIAGARERDAAAPCGRVIPAVPESARRGAAELGYDSSGGLSTAGAWFAAAIFAGFVALALSAHFIGPAQ